MMKCPRCGGPVQQGAVQCPRCGQRFLVKKTCFYCGSAIQGNAEICPVCGRRQTVQQARQAVQQYQPQYQVQVQPPAFTPKKKVKWWQIALGIFAFFVVVGAVFSGNDTDKPAKSSSSQASSSSSKSSSKSTSKSEDKTASKEDYIKRDFDTSGHLMIDAELLFEQGEYLGGEKVCTVITVESTSSDLLKAKTSNNDSIFFSINCEFQEKGLTGCFNEGDTVTVAGTVEAPSGVGSTVTLKDCTLIGLGEIGPELESGTEEQRAACEQRRAAAAESQAEQTRQDRDAYKAGCVTVDYDDVSRNPDAYKEKHVMISGEVIQVAEGWFDTVNMRIDCGGNIWYVTYSRAEGESRILEGDYITAYGECDGVTSYTTVLGSQVTIPSMKMEYYE